MVVSEIGGYLIGLLTIKESYSLGGAILGVPHFPKPPYSDLNYFPSAYWEYLNYKTVILDGVIASITMYLLRFFDGLVCLEKSCTF